MQSSGDLALLSSPTTTSRSAFASCNASKLLQHSETLEYFSMGFASTLVTLPNFKMCRLCAVGHKSYR